MASRSAAKPCIVSIFIIYHPLTVRLPSVDNHMVFLKYGLYQVAINAHEFFNLILSLFYWLRLKHDTKRKRKQKDNTYVLKQRTINAFLGRDATTAVSQLQWSQSLKNMFKTKVRGLRKAYKRRGFYPGGGFLNHIS